jgi:hypothetical protein
LYLGPLGVARANDEMNHKISLLMPGAIIV